MDLVNWRAVDDNVFNWSDGTYAPAILYTSGTGEDAVVVACGKIGSAYNEESIAEAAAMLSAKSPGDYTLSMKIVAVKKNSENLEYLVIKDINGSTTVAINESSYTVTFNGTSPASAIYYAFAGSNSGSWYWDKALRYQIGADGASIATETISDGAPASAQIVQNLIASTLSGGQYKAFVIIKGTDAYVVVDHSGELVNSGVLDGNYTAYMVDSEGATGTYDITLLDVDGNPVGSVTIVY